MRNADGAAVRVAVFARDVTEQKETEATLRRYAERLAALHDIDGAILSARSPMEIAAAALEGLRKLLPEAELQVVELGDRGRDARILATLSRDGSSPRDEPEVRTVPLVARGRTIGALRILTPSPLDAGHVEAVREVTSHLAVALEQAGLYEELEGRAEDLERAYRRLERLDKAKSDLLHVASHELRTPLTLVMGYGELLERHPGVAGDPDLSRMVNGVHGGAQRLKQILQDMLDVSALERRKADVPAVEIDLAEGPDAPAVELSVEDTGIGINPEDQQLIFDTFFRVGEARYHSSGRTKFKGGGPGLGLAIARRVVEAHGGRIWVESPGHDERACPGSRFVIVLPAAGATSA